MLLVVVLEPSLLARRVVATVDCYFLKTMMTRVVTLVSSLSTFQSF